mmetsp:Transcript_20592/g.26789  ORF Transcript_20592/g.26789 Transcript_20592/m.26789 type:complete len:348 (-) Transcript_20592:1353-2396(-)
MAALGDQVEENMASLSVDDAAAKAAAKKRDKKKRNKANKKKDSEGGAAEESNDEEKTITSGQKLDASTAQDLGIVTSDMSLEQIRAISAARKKKNSDQATQPHAFWDTQPVPKDNEEVSEVGPLLLQTVEEIRKEPYPMAAGMEWALVDINNTEHQTEVYNLLTENYVEDDDAMFRFDYSIPFLLWALTPPDYLPELHLGVRSSKTGKLMAFISGVPATMRVHSNKVEMVEINFLCVHKKLRSKRLAPVLIKEITRRVNVNGVFQAVYTAGVVLPSPVAQCRYWHRSLNPKKLVDIGFSRISERMNMARTIKLYKVAEFPKSHGIQPMREKHVSSACTLLNNYLAKQ